MSVICVCSRTYKRRWTKQIEGLSDLSYADRLKFLNLHSFQGRLLRADLIQYWKILNGRSSIVPTYIFQLSPETRTRGHRLKLFCPTVRTDVRKRFFSVRCLHVRNSFPASAVRAPDLSQFKLMLDVHIHTYMTCYMPMGTESSLCCYLHGRRKRGGGAGDAFPAVEKSAGDVPPRNDDISVSFFSTHMKIRHFPHFENKVTEIRGETKFWG